MKNISAINWYENFLIGVLAFVIILDPPNSYLHLKDPIFLLLLLNTCIFYKPTLSLFLPFILALIVWLFSSCIGYITLKIEDIDFNIGILKSFMPLILLGWIKHLDFRDKLVIPCFLISLISLCVLLAMLFFNEYEAILYGYFTEDNGLMMISRRSFIGIEFASAFYRSTPIIILPLANISYDIIFTNKSRNKIIIFIILFLGLFAGGNRACILSAVGIPIFIYLLKLYHDKRFYRFIFISISIIIIFLGALILLISDGSETSNAIKFGHLTSYLNYFNDNYNILAFGSGAGSKFFSKGFGVWTVQTEWTYIELLRYFGIIGCIIVIYIFIYPLIILMSSNRRNSKNMAIAIGYVFYLFLAGTNPLLLSSSGMIVCLYLYSYVFYKKNERGKENNRYIALDI